MSCCRYARRNGRIHSTTLWVSGVVVICLVFSLLVVVGMSEKSGVEFSPDDFSQRSFSYARVGWLNWTIRRISYSDDTTPFQTELTGKGLINSTQPTPRRWHLIEDSVTADDSEDFDARILFNYLKMESIQTWTRDSKNKKKAKVLWPAVAMLARNYAYWAVPDLMELVINDENMTLTEFKNQVDRLTVESLQLAAQNFVTEEQPAQAINAIDDGLSIRETKTLLELKKSTKNDAEESDDP